MKAWLKCTHYAPYASNYHEWNVEAKSDPHDYPALMEEIAAMLNPERDWGQCPMVQEGYRDGRRCPEFAASIVISYVGGV